MNSGLSFFKFISSSEKMSFPRESVARMQGIIGEGDRVILRDVDGKLWSVEVERDGDGFCFKKGWPQFYQENCLEPPWVVVVFTYAGGNIFNFRVHGGNACGNKPLAAAAAAPTFRVKEELVSEEEMDLNNDDEECSDDDDDDDDYVIEVVDSEEEDGEVCKSTPTSTTGRRGFEDDEDSTDGYESDGIEMVMDEEDDDKELTDSYESDGIEMVMEEEEEEATSKVKVEQCDEPLSSQTCISEGRKRRYKKQNVPDCYRHDIFDSGLAIRPKNPYFVSRSRKPRKNELYIPRDVIVDFKLKIPTRMFLVDGSGKKWETKMKKWGDGRLWCTRGWKSLCNVNNIGVDDTCICEFVQRPQDGLCMLVHAFN
ncbi:hypothetical protein C2S51_023651 [Perilla frutescens var. frutescens]|nr:hypothetical protein C2S51_023651 [Perilla frutescens var. frutescens]